MALTKVSGDFIQDGSITQGHLHASHGITTSDIGEGSNLYFTTARVDSRIGDLSTSDLSEGTNLYYTDARFNTAFAAKSTSDLSEGTNLYYTDTRVGSYLTTNSYATQSYVNTQVSNLVDSAPSTLDTLNELAAALGDDANFSTTVTNSIATKLPLTGGTLTGALSGTSATFSGNVTGANLNISNWDTAYGWGDHASGGYAADSAVMKLTGNQTISGTKTFDNGSIVISGTHGTISFMDTTSGEDNFYLHANSNNFYVLADRDATDAIDGGYESPHPLQLEADTNTAYVFGSALNIGNWDTAYGWGNHASAGYITSFDITTQTDPKYLRSNADDSFSGNLTSADNGWIKFYAAEETDGNDGKIGSGVFDTGLNIVGAQTSAGTGRQIRLWGNVITNTGSIFWNADNDGSGSGLDADLLDGLHASSFLQSESDTLATVTARGASTTISIESSGITSGTTAANRAFQVDATTKGALHSTSASGGTGNSADTAPLITFTGNGTSIQGGIYVSQNASTGTTLGFFTTDSYAAGPKQSLTIEDTGNVYVNRGFLQASSDLRAPIFYDLDDTNYYLNPASGSRINNIDVDGGAAYPLQTSSSQRYGISIRNTNNTVNTNYGWWWFMDTNFNMGFHADGAADRLTLTKDGDLIIGQTSISYTSNDNTPVVGSATTNRLHINGSIQLTNNDDALVIGRGTASFFKDEEIGFGWGGGWYMTDGTYLRVRNNKTVYSTGSIYAGLYYDSNDTNHYLDPASTSVVNTLKFSGSSNNGRFDADEWGVRFKTDAGYILFGPANTGHAHIYTDRSNFYFDKQIILNGGSTINAADIRASVFYDINDTTYYTNPNSQSSLRGVAIRGDLSTTATDNQIFFYGTGNTTTSAIGFKANGGNFANPTGTGDGWNTYLTMDTSGRGWVFRQGTGSNNFTSLYNSGWILNNGIWQANASMRAPIFYDSNDTGYYTDPSGLSVMHSIKLIKHVNNTPRWDFSAYVVESQHWYGNSGSQTMYLGESNYINIRNTADIHGDARAPIYYDRNNTGYYMDPDSTSRSGLLRSYLTFNDYGAGVVGTYDSYRYQLVFAMGDAYKGALNGTNVNSGYGIWWSHPNAGGVAGNLDDHAPMVIVNGGWRASLSGSTRAAYDMRAPIFYDLNDTGYYIDPNSTSNTNAMKAYQYQGNGNVGGTGSASWHPSGIYSAGHNWLYGGINAGGASVTNMGDARANIFYDYNSTSYYLDPASTSSLVTTNIDTCNWTYGRTGSSAQSNFGLNFGTNASLYMCQSTYSSGAYYQMINDTGTPIRIRHQVSSFDTTAFTDSIVIFNHNYWRGYVGILRSPEYPLDLNGQARLSGNYTTSDIRLKENVRDNDLGLSDLLQLRTVIFDWKTDEEILGRTLAYQNSLMDCRGFIAQEVEEVVPALVDTSEGEYPTKSIDGGAVTAMMVKAIQEQQAIIDDLKARIETLENQ